MPSANNAGINFASTAILWQLQNPLPAINFQSTGFLWQLQNPLPAINFQSTPILWQSQAGANVVYYYQRVFSSGLNVWCYYTTTGGIDPSPLSVATNPNWTGSIAAYELVTTSAV